MDASTLVRRALLAVVAALIVAVVYLLWREWLAPWVQAHPVWGASILGIVCFLAGALLFGARRTLGGDLLAEFRDAALILVIVVVLLVAGLILVAAATTLATEDVKGAALRTATLWALAWFVAGFLAGFLFGVPKVVAEGTAAAAQPGTPAAAWNFAQRPNTNLEQISDWLTKIIVGVGLVELKEIPRLLRETATWVAGTLSASASPSQAAVSFAGSVVVYFSIVGFLAGYLLTLLFLAGAFGRAG